MKSTLLTKICSVLLIISMMITMCPLSIFAMEEEGEEEILVPYDIYSADELQEALLGGENYIRILDDFEIDRTFYLSHSVTIFSDTAHTLTRSPNFGGDMFIVGKDSDGNICEENVTLTLGNSESLDSDLLTINGNSENMSVDVTGTAIFVCANAGINLYDNLTITNCVKVGNGETMTGLHSLSYEVRIGGAAIILAGGSSGNIYGGKYTNNSVNDITDPDTDEGWTSTHGGAIYNYGTLNVYGGIFSGNHAARGGAFYNYRTLNLYSAEIIGNTSSTFGGAIYMPASTVAYTYIGEENGITDSFVTFGANSAVSGGGAIYAKNIVTIKNASFIENTSESSGGAIFAPEMELSVSNSAFDGNVSGNNGGAVYLSGANSTEGDEFTAADSVFKNNIAQGRGGAIYANTATTFMENITFEANSGAYGGAVYSTGGTVDINKATVKGNTSTANGGFISLYSNSTARLNKITATENSSKSSGFAYLSESHLDIYDSTISKNSATTTAGAIYVGTSASIGAYKTVFDSNTATGNAGAVMLYTTNSATTPSIFHSCDFLGNSSSAYGGAIYASSNGSIAEFYNTTAKNNSAQKGGFMYETTTGTVITLAGTTVYGNTATEGGPIIWGNSAGAKLYIDKTKYVDMGNTGDWDDAYWSAAIYNSLTVIESSITIPTYIGYDGKEVIPEVISVPADVTTSAQLERAINAGHDLIRITASFELDRTFYIKNDMTIFSSSAVTLTRASDFGGDIFVIGETEDGTLIETAEDDRIVLTFGNKESTESNLLVIDGNKDNMTVTVTGSVIFVLSNSQADLYENFSVINCVKTGNSKTLNSAYSVSSYPENVGGAVAILTNGSAMKVYGGTYKNNSVSTSTVSGTPSVWGGAIFNHGSIDIYGGTFENNSANRAGFLYNYRTANIYNATIKGNTASSLGGAIYIPASTAAVTNIGTDNDLVESYVIFTENTSTGSGGAIYAQKYLKIDNALFSKNTSGSYGGALYLTDCNTKINNTTFEENTASGHGGTIYVTGAVEGIEKDLTISNSDFNSNVATNNGGAIYVTGSARMYAVKTDFTGNSATSGGAVYSTNGNVDINTSTVRNNTASSVGGFAAIYTNSTALLNAIDGENCSANTGGLVFVKNSNLELYNSYIKKCSAIGTHGGAVYVETGSNAKFYASTFENNTADDNGGALALYNAGLYDLIHSCTFIGNSSGSIGGGIWISNGPTVDIYNIVSKNNSSDKGGAMYITVSGTVVNLIGATFEGNTATTGGPIIWGNTYNAVLNIDKSKYTDLDHTGAYDDAYWSAAIVNKLTVNEITGEVPKYLDYGNESYDHMSDAVDVKNSAELEAAINSDAKYIRIVSDFEIDRTFYIGRNVTIFSTAPYTLTRSPNFTSDIFVIGEHSALAGSLVSNGTVTLTLGNPLSVKENLLTIDGNSQNMNNPVKGTVLFICNSSVVKLYDNITITNCYKTDNEKTYEAKYAFSRPNRIGGAAAIVHSGTLDIYGGNYKNNRIADEDTTTADDSGRNSSIGGLIYNYSNVIIRGGTFDGNTAARGGIVYNYRTVKIYGGNFINNHASVNGGVVYTPNTASAHLRIGTQYNAGDFSVLFENNTSVKHGGAIYTSSLTATLINGNVTFKNNKSLEGNGGALCIYGQLTSTGTTFTGNSAFNRGGAAYLANSSDSYVTRFIKFDNCKFTSNTALLGGALNCFAGSASLEKGAQVIVNNCTFKKNAAVKKVDSSSSALGGAIVADRKATLTVTDSSFSQNSAATEAGAIYLAGKSVAKITGTSFTSNYIVEGGTHGGAIVVRSSKLTADNITLTNNSSVSNGGAVYISYQSAQDVNSDVNITNSSFKGNYAGSYAGAIYATRQTVENDKRILTVSDTEFIENSAENNAGAIQLAKDVDAYFKNVIFSKNSAINGYGGALSTAGAIMTFETAEFSENTALKSGGAIYIDGPASLTLYDVDATNNSSNGSGGFMHNDSGAIKIYDSTFKGNSALGNGGALTVYGTGSSEIYGCEFIDNKTTGNISSSNGGAIFYYNAEKNNILHSCTFTGNSGSYGGAIYASNKALGSFYNITATNNSAEKGGFFYETTTGTTFNIAGLTVSGNTATSGGPIIWGNSNGAVLNIDKSKYTDNDATGELDDTYWASAIYNKLTVNYVSLDIPSYTPYSVEEEEETTPTVKEPVPVTDVLNLPENSKDGYINSYYDKFVKLDNTSNFMSKNTTTFENINGNTVTVDSFIYPYNGTADNCNVGQGLLIYQAILYKQAHPEKEVYIDISSYRFSIAAAININRDSRYYGYMRNLFGAEYDSNGFVRISYLLITAAKMGIHVNVLGHIDAYPTSASDPTLEEYFTKKLNDPCDPAYVENGVIGDYLDFNKFDWSLDNKGGTDMMHTKMCAVSHYLDFDGVEHQNAVWSSSSNLDGVTTKGYNGNYKLQTATIVSGHAEIYRTATNYLRLIANYKEQEQVYEFHEIISQINAYQIGMILAGREEEIPESERIVYLGSENDKVFELYFTPFGGDQVVWDEANNPYCKYLRKMYNSEDYILFAWNTAEYNGNFPLGQQIEEVITASFHDNRNVNNRFYAIMDSYDPAKMSDLKVGTDIGFLSINQRDFGLIHNKDMQMSYVENGQRYYVSLLNSCNLHSGSMCYQSNFMLVIKETECSEDSVFFTLADNSTTGIVEHDYGDELTHEPANGEHGYTYKVCAQCGKTVITGDVHPESEWITDKEATAESNGIQHKECTVCNKIMETREVIAEKELSVDLRNLGKTFSSDDKSLVDVTVDKTPHTIEATVQVPKYVNGRAGVILGNYIGDSSAQLNLEIFTYGRVRLYVNTGTEKIDCIFLTDIRSDNRKNITVTLDGNIATLYIDGVISETKTLSATLPDNITEFKIGGDNRKGNTQYFKGTIYSVNLFSDVRNSDEITRDALLVSADEEDLIYSEYFVKKNKNKITTSVYPAGRIFNEINAYSIDSPLSATPYTFEAIIQIDKNMNDAAGVIIGNYKTETGVYVNIEAAESGKIRLVFNNGNSTAEHIFSEDIRSANPTHIAVTVNGNIAILYVDGVETEKATLGASYSDIKDSFKVGGDNREDNTNYFKGIIYSASIFGDVRTSEEIRNDIINIPENTDSLLYSTYFTSEEKEMVLTAIDSTGMKFTATNIYSIDNFDKAPHTFEATVRVPTTYTSRAGVIIGNYDAGTGAQMNIEVYTEGRIRLFYNTGTQKNEHIFSTDIRSDSITHIAITIDGTTAILYVDGVAVETAELSLAFPDTLSNFKIGGDNREGNTQYFRGTVYSASIFSDVRTAEEIKKDAVLVEETDGTLLFSKHFAAINNNVVTVDKVGKTFAQTEMESVEELDGIPLTFEATVNVPENISGRAGVILGNYDGGNGDQITLEVYTLGRVKLHIVNNSERGECLFSTDIRSSKATHIAVTVDGTTATLYVDGIAKETKTLSISLPETMKNIKLGGDNRSVNAQYFKGTIYSVNMFSDVRTAQEIQKDSVLVLSNTESLLYSGYYIKEDAYDYSNVVLSGKTYNGKNTDVIGNLAATPHTFEAVINIPRNMTIRGGVIVGNYNNGTDQVNLEVYNYGRVRLFFKNGVQKVDCLFSTDIRSDKPVHITVTVDGLTATLYVNGEVTETKNLIAELPQSTDNFNIGDDNRGNAMYFKGMVYSINLFSDIRTAEEIKKDMNFVDTSEETLLYSQYFTEIDGNAGASSSGKTFNAKNKSTVDTLSSTPYTIEATVNVPTTLNSRAGVIVSNYASSSNSQISLEVYTKGKVKLFINNSTKQISYVFATDIRSHTATHIAVTIDGSFVTLYVNGIARERLNLGTSYTNITEGFTVGGDSRTGNTQYFKGTIYNVSLFGDVRTAEEIMQDALGISNDAESLLYNKQFTSGVCSASANGDDHTESDWITDYEPSETKAGIKFKECTACHKLLVVNEVRNNLIVDEVIDYRNASGLTFNSVEDAKEITNVLDGTPHTFEVTMQLPTTYTARAGVLIGNYDGTSKDGINFEIYNSGKPRLYFKSGNVGYTYPFKTDVRSDSITHIAITIDGTVASLYVNGVLKETTTLTLTIPEVSDGYFIGNDRRTTNPQYFKGTIYAVNLFSDVRTAEEIANDAIMVTDDADNLIYSKYFLAK